MRDPRLAELDFLAFVERRGAWSMVEGGSAEGGPPFGLSRGQFKEMVVDLLIRQLLNGPAKLQRSDNPPPIAIYLRDYVQGDIWRWLSGRQLIVQLNHEGRKHLYSLRDTLLSASTLDAFGIMPDKRQWEREWNVMWSFLDAGKQACLMLFDLDGFKAINDRCGHQVGDDCIREYLRVVVGQTTDKATSFL